MNVWSVYLVRTVDGALYTGITTDTARRLGAHREGRGAKALRGRGPLALVYRCRIGDRGLAQRVEARVKRLAKADKEALVQEAPTRGRLLRAIDVIDVKPRP